MLMVLPALGGCAIVKSERSEDLTLVDLTAMLSMSATVKSEQREDLTLRTLMQ